MRFENIKISSICFKQKGKGHTNPNTRSNNNDKRTMQYETKHIGNLLNRNFTIDEETRNEEYGEYVQKTAKLLKRNFAQMHMIFEKEDWSLEKIKSRYHEATKHSGDMPPSVWWWWKRKQDKQV